MDLPRALAPLAKLRPPLRPWPGRGVSLPWSCCRAELPHLRPARHWMTWERDKPLARTEPPPLFPYRCLLEEGPQESVSSSRAQLGHV